MRRRERRSPAHFARRAGGNIALTSAFVMGVLVILGGGMMDVAQISMLGSTLQGALDAAALSGAKAGNDYLLANGTNADDVKQAMKVAKTAAANNFQRNNSNDPLSATTTSSAAFDGKKTTVTMAASEVWATNFLGLIGIPNVTIKRSSTTAADYGHQYYQVIFIADTSGSMGIGATPADITKLTTTPGFNGCAFACHDPNQYYSTTDFRALAAKDNIKLKVDYENSAINAFMTQLSSIADNYPGQFSVSIYTYATNNHAILQNFVLNSAADATTASQAAATIDMEPIGPSWTNWGYTQTTQAWNYVNSQVANIGDGSSPTKMKTYVVFVSDGVEDVPNAGGPYGRKMSLGYSCDALKAKGASVFTIWTQYNQVADAQWNYFIQPIQNQLPTTMQSCASSSQQYFNAADGPGIQSAVQQIFQAITSQANVRVKS